MEDLGWVGTSPAGRRLETPHSPSAILHSPFSIFPLSVLNFPFRGPSALPSARRFTFSRSQKTPSRPRRASSAF
jgi:hypothetical protein